MTAAAALASVLARAEGQAWAGNDPYDGLTTEIGRLVMPLGWLPRFGLSQIVLRFPLARWALRPVRTVNSKALALFLGATVAGRGELGDARARSAALNLVDELARRGTKFDSDSTGWGYPFPWQSRSFWAPANTPNAVVTGTVGWHLLTCWEVMGIDRARSLGLAAAAFLARGLRATEGGRGEALAYTPSDHTRVVNISAIAARLLALSATLQSSEPLRGKAGRLVRFVLDVQRPDGSWPYSADPGGTWEDSFHTGYVLEALINVNELGIPVPVEALARGFAAYARFFDPDGGARLYSSPSSIFDAHSAAQGIITYAALDNSSYRSIPAWEGARTMALRIASWAREALWLPSKGHFAYRIHGGRRDEREFTRWVQAWMAVAMATAAGLEAKTTVSSAPIKAVGAA